MIGFVLSVALMTITAQASSAPAVFVSNERGGTITVIDGAADQPVQTIPVGARPRGIQVSPDGRTLYVALSDNASRVQGSADAVPTDAPRIAQATEWMMESIPDFLQLHAGPAHSDERDK